MGTSVDGSKWANPTANEVRAGTPTYIGEVLGAPPRIYRSMDMDFEPLTGDASKVGKVPEIPGEISRSTTDVTFPKMIPTRCEARGHRLNPDVVRYTDGLIVAHCAECDDRFEIPAFSGGTSAVRIRGLVAEILDAMQDGEDAPEELLGLLVEASAALDRDFEELEDAAALIKTVRKKLAASLT